jgi:hypothetical protein
MIPQEYSTHEILNLLRKGIDKTTETTWLYLYNLVKAKNPQIETFKQYNEAKKVIDFLEWLNGEPIEIPYSIDSIGNILINLPKVMLVGFTRRYFEDIRTQKITFSITTLENITNVFSSQNRLIDFSTYFVLESIKTRSKNEEYFSRNPILDILLNYFDHYEEVEFSDYFDNCSGRVSTEKNKFDHQGTFTESKNGKWIYLKTNTQSIPIDELKSISGVWDKSESHWYFPIDKKEYIIYKAINKSLLYLDKDNNYVVPKELFPILTNFGKKNIFCEGSLPKIAYRYHKIDRPNLTNPNLSRCICRKNYCYKPNTTRNVKGNWQEYTLLDFCKIIGYESQQDDAVTEAYVKLIGWINRVKQLVAHSKCRECGNWMRAHSTTGGLAAYGVTRFICRDEKCEGSHEKNVVTLTHCFSCVDLIDSRDSKRCPNGLLICSNKNCGVCCSKSKHQNINHDHYLENKHFCFLCGTEMTETNDNTFSCHNNHDPNIIKTRKNTF